MHNIPIFQHLLPLILYVAVPLYLLIRLLNNQNRSFWKWSIDVCLSGTYILTLFLIGFWSMTYSYFTIYALLIFFFVAVVKSFFNTSRTFAISQWRFRAFFFYSITILLIVVFMADIFMALEGHLCPSHSIGLEFPLRNGRFCIVQGGTSQIINHHFEICAQRYGIDIVKLNQFGLRASTWTPTQLSDFNIYETPVYSPCEGVVIEVVDLYQDLEPPLRDVDHPAGNYLAIAQNGSDVIIILAHLKNESLKVSRGDHVLKGQALAKVGNSGNTTEPHLHIHAVLNNTGDFLFTGTGVPMLFNEQFLVRNDRRIIE